MPYLALLKDKQIIYSKTMPLVMVQATNLAEYDQLLDGGELA